MKDSIKPIVVVGSGIAGYSVIKQLRHHDEKVPMIMISKDAGDYYSKPALSTALTKKISPTKLVITKASVMAQQLKIDIVPECHVKFIDTLHKSIETSQGTIYYQYLVLACGGAPRVLPQVKELGKLIHQVNHLGDYINFHGALKQGAHVTILGSGLVGCEFANDLVNAGYKASIITPDNYPLQTLVPEPIAMELENRLTLLGTKWYKQVQVASIDESSNEVKVNLSNGESIQANLLLLAIGLNPQLTIAQKSGLKFNRGIVVNHYGQTSVPDVFALGDCAEIYGKVMPFIAPIRHSALAMAKTLLGHPTTIEFPPMPIVIKTPAYPLIVCNSQACAQLDAKWCQKLDGTEVLYLDMNKRLKGYVLTQQCTTEHMSVLELMNKMVA